MDLYEILFLALFLGLWLILVTKVFPRFGVGS
jgi:hypothetical protein